MNGLKAERHKQAVKHNSAPVNIYVQLRRMEPTHNTSIYMSPA